MPQDDLEVASPGDLAGSQSLADALESDRFRTFLDHIPFAVAVSELQPQERIVYANPEFEHLIGVARAALDGRPWSALPETIRATASERPLSEVIATAADYLGTFKVAKGDGALADAWSNLIQDDAGFETFRLVALSNVANRPTTWWALPRGLMMAVPSPSYLAFSLMWRHTGTGLMPILTPKQKRMNKRCHCHQWTCG